MDYVVSLDTTESVTEGIKEIVDHPADRYRAGHHGGLSVPAGLARHLIPLLAVPVSLIGTFIIFPVFGFSINTLSLFGLVLAIGLVVDDAIVVVEAVERHIEEGLAPKAAALKAMEEISGPVIGIALVLSAVFVPTVFIPGITGRLYQQFAVTIAISVILSAFNALTLSPALSALLLRPKTGEPRPAAPILRLVQPRVRPRHQRLHPLVRRADPQERGGAGAAGGGRRGRRVLQRHAFPPASCRTRTRATCSCTCSFPNAASLERTEAACREGRKDSAAHSGREIHHRALRLQPAELRAAPATTGSSSSRWTIGTTAPAARRSIRRSCST